MSSLLGIVSNCITTDFYEISTIDELVNDFLEAKKDKFTLLKSFEGFTPLINFNKFSSKASYLDLFFRVRFSTNDALLIELLKRNPNRTYQLLAYNFLKPLAGIFDFSANYSLYLLRTPIIIFTGIPAALIVKITLISLKFFNLHNQNTTHLFWDFVGLPFLMSISAFMIPLIDLIGSLIDLINFCLFNKLAEPLESISLLFRLPGGLVYNKNEEKIEFILDIERLKHLKNKVKFEGITEEDIIEFSKALLMKNTIRENLPSFEIRGDELIISLKNRPEIKLPIKHSSDPYIKFDETSSFPDYSDELTIQRENL